VGDSPRFVERLYSTFSQNIYQKLYTVNKKRKIEGCVADVSAAVRVQIPETPTSLMSRLCNLHVEEYVSADQEKRWVMRDGGAKFAPSSFARTRQRTRKFHVQSI
jgi:hypothetical protein